MPAKPQQKDLSPRVCVGGENSPRLAFEGLRHAFVFMCENVAWYNMGNALLHLSHRAGALKLLVTRRTSF